MKVLRVLSRVLIGVVALAALVMIALIGRGYLLVNATYHRPVPDLHIVRDLARVARGRHVAEIRCLGCHSHPDEASLPLAGGTVETFENPLRLDRATLPYPNLTPGGVLRDWSDGEIARAIREGIDRGGRALMIMPAEQFRNLSDADVAALIAFLRSQPTVPGGTARRHDDWYTLLLFATGQLATRLPPPVFQPVPEVEPGLTADYGRYLGASLRCGECHGPALHGTPVAPDLHYYAQQNPESLFVRAVQRGIRSDGTPVKPFMPWKYFGRLTRVELGALYRWLKTAS